MEEFELAKIKAFVWGVSGRISSHRLSLVSAGVAFYIFLSIFPALAATISIYGLAADPEVVQNHVETLGQFMPKEALSMISARIRDLTSSQDSSLTFGLMIGIALSLWSANKAMKGVAQALNIAYDREEDRGFVKVNAVTLALTLASSIAFIVALSVVVVVPILINAVLSIQSIEWIAIASSWTVFIAVLIGMFLLIYYFAPALHEWGWRDLLPGAIVAAILFLIASVGFSLYVANFGKYDKQYGALGAVVITLLWLYIGSYIFLLGAEINAQRNQGGKPDRDTQPGHPH